MSETICLDLFLKDIGTTLSHHSDVSLISGGPELRLGSVIKLPL